MKESNKNFAQLNSIQQLALLLENSINLEDLNKNLDTIIDDITNNNQPKFFLHDNSHKVVLLSTDEYLNLISEERNPISKEVVKPLEEITLRKIGMVVKRTFEYLEKNNLLSPKMITKLCDTEYSTNTFGISFPILKKFDSNYSIKDQAVEGEKKKHNRYWHKLFNFNGSDYLVCSQWYDRHRERFEKWCQVNFDLNPNKIS